MPSNRYNAFQSGSLPGLVVLFVLLAFGLNGIGAEAVPLAFQSIIGTPTPTPTFDPLLFPTATPTFDPNLFPTATATFDPNLPPTATPTYDPNLFPTATPTIDMMLPPQVMPTAALPLPANGPTDSLSSVLESPQGMPAAPEALPLLPKPDPGAAAPAAPPAADPAGEARLFGRTVMAALTYVWMGCGVMLLLLAGAAFLWLHRRSKLR